MEVLKPKIDIFDARKNDFEKIAGKWGVSPETIERMEMQVCGGGWLFPMKDEQGQIFGHRIRWFKGGKGTLEGEHLGLFLPVDTIVGAIQVVTEGESDLAVALELGITAIARPCASACTDMIVKYLAGQRFSGITIIADRDSDDLGFREAEQLAETLLTNRHIVRVILPPEPYKDLRDWFLQANLDTKGFWDHARKFKWKTPADSPPCFFAIASSATLAVFDIFTIVESFSLAIQLIITPLLTTNQSKS